jgi:hypothetical protein
VWPALSQTGARVWAYLLTPLVVVMVVRNLAPNQVIPEDDTDWRCRQTIEPRRDFEAVMFEDTPMLVGGYLGLSQYSSEVRTRGERFRAGGAVGSAHTSLGRPGALRLVAVSLTACDQAAGAAVGVPRTHESALNTPPPTSSRTCATMDRPPNNQYPPYGPAIPNHLHLPPPHSRADARIPITFITSKPGDYTSDTSISFACDEIACVFEYRLLDNRGPEVVRNWSLARSPLNFKQWMKRGRHTIQVGQRAQGGGGCWGVGWGCLGAGCGRCCSYTCLLVEPLVARVLGSCHPCPHLAATCLP